VYGKRNYLLAQMNERILFGYGSTRVIMVLIRQLLILKISLEVMMKRTKIKVKCYTKLKLWRNHTFKYNIVNLIVFIKDSMVSSLTEMVEDMIRMMMITIYATPDSVVNSLLHLIQIKEIGTIYHL